MADSGEPAENANEVLARLPKWVRVLLELQERLKQEGLHGKKQEQDPSNPRSTTHSNNED